MKSKLLVLFIFLVPLLSKSQDSLMIKRIDSLSQYAYDHTDTTLYYLTTTDFFNTGESSKVHVYQFENKIQRIVCISRYPSGEYAIEFYFYNELPVFIFETTSYAREKTPSWSEKNFQGIHASDHRYYFRNGKLVNSYGTGTDPKRSISKHSEQLLKACSRIIEWYKKAG